MRRYYAGIGSRETPLDVQSYMTQIAVFLGGLGYTLRSGAADGADAAFEVGVADDGKEIYLPWRGFNGHSSELYRLSGDVYEHAKKYHPCWHKLSAPARALIARDSYQILGYDLKTPVDFIVCWTPGGKMKGGTAQAIRIAKESSIPVFNLAKSKDRIHIDDCIQTKQRFV